MKQYLNKHLVKAIADLAIFLEFTDTNLLNADASINAMEQLSSELQLLDGSTKRILAMQLVELADDYEKETAEFLKNLPETLGFI